MIHHRHATKIMKTFFATPTVPRPVNLRADPFEQHTEAHILLNLRGRKALDDRARARVRASALGVVQGLPVHSSQVWQSLEEARNKFNHQVQRIRRQLSARAIKNPAAMSDRASRHAVSRSTVPKEIRGLREVAV